jgi:hypothetical protein
MQKCRTKLAKGVCGCRVNPAKRVKKILQIDFFVNKEEMQSLHII